MGQPYVYAVAGGGGPEERERQVVGQYCAGSLAHLELAVRVGQIERSHLLHASHDLRALTHRVEEREGGQPCGVVRRGCELVDDLCNGLPRLAVQVLPVSAKRDRVERLERLVVVALPGELARNAGEAPDRGRSGPGPLERIDPGGSDRGLSPRKAEL